MLAPPDRRLLHPARRPSHGAPLLTADKKALTRIGKSFFRKIKHTIPESVSAAYLLPMRYVSLDLETSGSDPLRHQVLELAAVVEDTKRPRPLAELPAFRRLLIHAEIVGTPGALVLNARLLAELAAPPLPPPTERCTPAEVLPQLREFLVTQGFRPDDKDLVRFVLAGKNVAVFDLLFLQQLPGWGTIIKSEPAVIDPALLYLNWRKDSRLPSMAIAKTRAQFPDPTVAHEALADALDVVQLLRPFYKFSVYKRARGEE